MDIISESNHTVSRGYTTSQFRYAATYVLITLLVLCILNIYCANSSQNLFLHSKEGPMIEKCQLAADEVRKLRVMNSATVRATINQLDSLTATRLLVTDQNARVIYDSAETAVGRYALLPEILRAMDGNSACTGSYDNGVIQTQAAAPSLSYGTVLGCVYMMEYDTNLGGLMKNLMINIFTITLVLQVILVVFSIVFSNRFSRRLRQIMASMRIIQQGDYTHKVEMDGDDELAYLGHEFNDLADRLNTSEEKRRRFVSDASHELKTPLASIKLLTDSILQNDMDVETLREFVVDIGNEADRLNRMTAKLLSLTKVDGAVSQEAEIISMSPTIERVVRMLSAQAQQQEISIQLDIQDDCPVLILEDDLYQIVFNLVENGIKYNIAGGVLRISLHRELDNAVLRVTDSGMGIPSDSLDHIFERFYRVDKARSRATGGSGLGLAIVKTIVQKNRGFITVDSVLDQGTCFTVIFPIFDTEEDET